jgi:hypothetical protein
VLQEVQVQQQAQAQGKQCPLSNATSASFGGVLVSPMLHANRMVIFTIRCTIVSPSELFQEVYSLRLGSTPQSIRRIVDLTTEF